MDQITARPSPVAQHFAVLREGFDPAGKRFLDIGCGGGDFLRQLLAAGADAVGLEVFQAPLDRAMAAGIPAARLGLFDGQSLPFADGAFDAAAFVFSFHHVPGDGQAAMLAEVARVLRPGGALFVFEPRPFGPTTEILRPIHDETGVRSRSQALLDAGPAPFRLAERREYRTVRHVASCEQLVQGAIAVDPDRAEAAARPGVMADVAARFAEVAEPAEGGGYRLVQPCLFYRLER